MQYYIGKGEKGFDRGMFASWFLGETGWISALQFKTFYLTPSSGKRNTTQPVEQEKKERKREGTVEVEYKETSQPPPDVVCYLYFFQF